MSALQIPEAARTIVRDRSGGRCERCGSTDRLQVHHRCPRKSGGTQREWVNQPANLVRLCGDCHDEIEGNRARAYVHGWLVHDTGLELDRPHLVKLHGFRSTNYLFPVTVLLHDDGLVTVLWDDTPQHPEEAAA